MQQYRDRDRERGLRIALLGLPGIIFIFAVFIVPLAFIIYLGFQVDGQFSFGQFERILNTEVYRLVLWRTLVISVVVTALDFLLAYPLAVALSRAKGVARAAILAAILMPFLTNLLVRAYGWIVIMHPNGLISSVLIGSGIIPEPLELVQTTTGVLIGMTQIMLPFMTLPIAAQIQKMDTRLVPAARSLGASAFQAFLRVYFPMTLPGVFAGVLIVFVMNIGYFVIPVLLGGRRDVMMAQFIDMNFTTLLNWELAAALSTVLLVLTVTVFLVAQRWFRFDSLWMEAK